MNFMQAIIILTICLQAIIVMACSDIGTTPPKSDDNGAGDGISFAADVMPIIRTNCHTAACHAGGLAGFSSADYNSITGSANHGALVKVGNASASNLYLKVTADSPFGARMPLNKDTLTTAEQNLIRDWINEGAKDN